MPKKSTAAAETPSPEEPEHSAQAPPAAQPESPPGAAVESAPSAGTEQAGGRMIEDLVPKEFTAQEGATGECPAKVDPEKWHACLVMNVPESILHYTGPLQAYGPLKKGDRGKDGELVVQNEDAFVVDERGFLTKGDCIVVVWTAAAYEQLRARDIERVRRAKYGEKKDKESATERAADAAASSLGDGVVVEEARISTRLGGIP